MKPTLYHRLPPCGLFSHKYYKSPQEPSPGAPDRYIIDDNDNVDTINVWDCCFTEEILKQEITRSGFKIKNLYADVTGRNFALKSKTMAIVAQK